MYKKILSTLLISAFVLGSSTTANAQELSVRQQKEQIVQSETGRPIDSRIKPQAGSYDLYGYDDAFHKDQQMMSAFDASLKDNFFGSKMSGQSRATWWGSNPTNAIKINLDTTIKLTGAGISCTVGSSGFDVSGSLVSKTLTMSDSIKSNWRLYQDYSNVTFDGVDLYYRQTATAKFSFGQDVYYTNATDSVWP